MTCAAKSPKWKPNFPQTSNAAGSLTGNSLLRRCPLLGPARQGGRALLSVWSVCYYSRLVSHRTDQVTKQVVSTLGSLLITASPALLQQADGFKTTLPTCLDHLLVTRNMDTTSLATTFPFTSSELTSNEGILYGLNEHNGSLVILTGSV